MLLVSSTQDQVPLNQPPQDPNQPNTGRGATVATKGAFMHQDPSPVDEGPDDFCVLSEGELDQLFSQCDPLALQGKRPFVTLPWAYDWDTHVG